MVPGRDVREVAFVLEGGDKIEEGSFGRRVDINDPLIARLGRLREELGERGKAALVATTAATVDSRDGKRGGRPSVPCFEGKR